MHRVAALEHFRDDRRSRGRRQGPGASIVAGSNASPGSGANGVTLFAASAAWSCASNAS